MTNKTIIAIHGVGETEDGEILSAFGNGLNLQKAYFKRNLINGTHYSSLISETEDLEIIETNWSDVLQPKKNIYSVFKHLGKIISAMFSFTEEQFNGRFLRLFNPISVFRFLLEGLLLGATTIAIIASIGVEMGNQRELGLTLMITSSFILLFLCYKGKFYSKNYILGILHILPIIALVSLIFFGSLDVELIQSYANKYRTFVIVAISTIWFCLTVLILLKYLFNNESIKPLTELAFITLPYVAFNAFGTILTLAHLLIFKSTKTSPLPFDLAKMELATTISYSIIGAIPIIFLISYVTYRRRRTLDNSINKHGRIAQRGIKILLLLAPLILVPLSIYSLILFIQGQQPEATTLDIYKISILRLIPFLAWVAGPISIILDVIGDILFYINPDQRAKYSIQNECKSRLKNIIKNEISKGKTHILIAAHSWGTVVANDVLSENDFECELITLGSPLESLCVNFLGRDLREMKSVKKWINAFRDGDYIAGPIRNQKVENINTENGGHTDYWGSVAINSLIKKQLNIGC